MLTENTYSSGHLVMINFGLLLFLVLRPVVSNFFPFPDTEFRISFDTSVVLCNFIFNSYLVKLKISVHFSEGASKDRTFMT